MTTSSQLLVPPSKFNSFLKKAGWHNASYSFLAGDASLRKYHRLKTPKGTAVLMEAPAPENPELFCQIARFLKTIACAAPDVFEFSSHDGLVLLEDFGDLTFSRALQQGAKPLDLYTLAVEALIHLQKSVSKRPSFIGEYTTQSLVKEALVFLEWYWPQVKKYPPSAEETAEYVALWTSVFETCTAPKTLVLRDFHADNLMLLNSPMGPQKCGFLDFQDALWGSPTYDLVSLLEDARLDVAHDLVEQIWVRYCQSFPALDPVALRQEGCIVSAGRHTKILGVFTRLAVRDHKKHYLDHIPRVWRLLNGCLESPILQNLRYWFNRHFPPPGGALCL